uniref:HTH CENPB-type domain-containing protein n=2 Tax=Micrurus TaxID=8634 RepID=A0A2D4Q5L4_MICSU
MGPKKARSGNADKGKRKAVRTTIELKKEIIAKYEQGTRVSDLSAEYGMPRSTISTFLKNKVVIKAANVAKGVTLLTKQRPQIMEEMEKLLLIFIKEKELAGDSINEVVICEKALQIFSDLNKETPGTSGEGAFTFKASRGWFENFRHRSGIHRITRHGEAASANQEAANKFIKEFSDYVKAEGFLPEQVFNCDETGLFWKKIPANTYITKEEKSLPGHKPMKDRLTLLFCANASGDCKVKPLLVYHSDNPRPFKRHNVMKSKLAVMWRSNTKAWVTRQFFTEWVREVFAPRVKEYLAEQNLPLKCLLLMDNAPAHPPALEEDLVDDCSFIKVKFLPPNTTPILQPMDQQVISNFKKLYTKALFRKCFEVTNDTQLTLREFWKEHFNILNCVNLIDTAWCKVTHRTLYSAWQKLWPESESEGLEPESAPVVDEDLAVIDDIVAIGNTMGLNIQQDDINELVEGHAAELTTEELMHLQQQQQKDMVEEISSEEEERVEDISSGLIHEMCAKWAEIANFVEQHHPDKVVANRAVNIFNDNVMSTFRKILQRRKKQQTIDKFFRKEIRQATAEQDSDSPQQTRQRREKTPEEQLPSVFVEEDSPLRQ